MGYAAPRGPRGVMVLRFIVVLSCSACGSLDRAVISGEECSSSPTRVHVDNQEPTLAAWQNSHHAPAVTVLGQIAGSAT